MQAVEIVSTSPNAHGETIGHLQQGLEQLHTEIKKDAHSLPEAEQDMLAADVIKAQADQALHLLEGVQPNLQVSEEEQIRRENHAVEETLGITSPAQRMVEASLFIDPPFWETALLRGDAHPEELFGIRAWKGWLEARASARDLPDTVTIDDIKSLHAVIAQGLSSGIQGEIRTDTMIGGDYTQIGSAITFTQEQIDSIESNPLLKITFTDREKNEGYILYPCVRDWELFNRCKALLPPDSQATLGFYPTNDRLVTALLTGFLQRFNETPPTDKTEILARAAELQRQFVSIHPFTDGNGRLSRLLMNAYLQRAGVAPAVLEHGEDDLFYSKEGWEEEVREGCERYRRLKAKAQEGTTQREVLDDNYTAYFDQVYHPTHSLPAPGDQLRHREYRAFLEGVHEGYTQFRVFTQAPTTHSGIEKEGDEIEMGGLIPQEYIASWGNTRPEVQQHVRQRYYHSQEVFRGGMAEKVDAPRDILRLFLQPIAMNAAYRPITRAYASPMSIRPLPVAEIKRTLQDYNQAVISDYSHRVNPNESIDTHQFEQEEEHFIQNIISKPQQREGEIRALQTGKYLPSLLHYHQEGGRFNQVLWLSPAVSTSTDRDVSYMWAQERTYFHPVPEGSKGILVASLLPRYGVIYSPEAETIPMMTGTGWQALFKEEKEFLVMGAIDPNAVTAITLYSSDQMQAEAKREGNVVLFKDYAGNVEERYVFDEHGALQLSGRRTLEETEIPTTPL